MASIFGDESADETKQRVFAVAAVMGTDEQWEALIPKWLHRTGNKVFHAATCESEFVRDPDRSKHKENLNLYKDLVQLIVGSGINGVGVAADLAGHRKAFPDVPQDIMYYKCFTEVSLYLLNKAADLGYRENLEFTFDNRQESEKNTGFIYDWIVNQAEWKEKDISMGLKIGFSNIRDPHIQIADLMARETMKYLNDYLRHQYKEKPHRKSFQALASTDDGRFQFNFLMQEYFEQMRQKQNQIAEVAGFSQTDYALWLKTNKIGDNVSNRLRFLLWFESEELLRKNGSK